MAGSSTVGRRRGSVWRVLFAVVLLAAAVGAGWWAARATLEPREQQATGPSQQEVWAAATESSVGRSLPLSTTLRQPARTVATNTLSGVVLSSSPGKVKVGDTVYVVAGTPVRVIEGSVPFYRDLAKPDDPKKWLHGRDVRELQRALSALGYLEGKADGEYGLATEKAVKAWQKDLRIPQTGRVDLGEVIAVDALPTVVQVGESIKRGKVLAGGEDALLAPTGEQQFVLVVSQDQAKLIPAEATVQVTWQEHTWKAVIAGSTQDDQYGNTEFELIAPDGGPVCGKQCDTLPGDAQVTLRSQVVIVPELTGTAVPAAAVHTKADSTAYVITKSGEVPVTVRGSGGGIAIVDGIEVGTQVQALAGSAPGQLPPQPPPPPGDGSTGTGG